MISGRTSLQWTWHTRSICRSRNVSGSPPANVMWPASNSRPTSALVRAHQAFDIGRRFDIRAHVMMVRDAHAVAQRVRGELVEAFGVFAPLLVGEKARTLIERLRRTLDRIRHFAIHHDRRAVFREQVEMRPDGGDLVLGAALGEPSRVPARYQREIVLREQRLQRLWLAGKLVAQLEALIADAPTFGQRDIERRFAAERGQVVVHPRERVDADAYVESRHGRFPCSLFLIGLCWSSGR